MLRSILHLFVKKRTQEIYALSRSPQKIQEKELFSIIKKVGDTEWGKEHEYKNITSVGEFKDKVPVSFYEEIHPLIDRMISGEENVLWPGIVKWFSKSSGTTNDKSKYIPVPDASLKECNFKGAKDQLILYSKNVPDSSLFRGKTLGVGGSFSKMRENPDIFVGDVSAVMMKQLPRWGEYLRTPSIDTALMSEWEEKIEKMADESIREDVRGIAGVPTWTIVLIKKILEKTGKKNILEVWPNLEVFFHGAVSFDPYREIFKELIPKPDMNYMETYNASEGFFAIQDDLKDNKGMLLGVDYGIFYEFMELNELGKKHPKTHLLHEVELDMNYVMVITTNGGLPRYILGDTIMFTTLAPYRIKIVGRTKHFINVFGEELMVHNADTAITHASSATGARVFEYTVCPIFMGAGSKGGHEWLIEFETSPKDAQHFIDEVDKKLRLLNSDYDAKRYKDIALTGPVIKIIPKGTFHKWLKSRGKLGGQNKVPRLSNSREYAEAIFSLIK